jgi:hypothetical protein
LSNAGTFVAASGPWSLDVSAASSQTLAAAGGQCQFQYDNGAFFFRSATQFRSITRGTSNVYMLGEKYMSPDRYSAVPRTQYSGADGPGAVGAYQAAEAGDNLSAYGGFSNNILRCTLWTPHKDGTAKDPTTASPYTIQYNPTRSSTRTEAGITASKSCLVAPTKARSTWPCATGRSRKSVTTST